MRSGSPPAAKPPPPAREKGRETGVALLAVLLLVAVLSTIAVGILDDIRFSRARAANGALIAQARWYALGAEALARTRITDIIRRNPVQTANSAQWQGVPQTFPIDGGLISATLRDGGNCFNLNSVVMADEDQLVRRETYAPQFLALAKVLEIKSSDATRIFDALVDWIDSNQLREGDGAEDDVYLRAATGYRTGSTLLAEASEMRAIEGVSAEYYRKLRPFVCALPTVEAAPINVNTLTEAQAPLLVMLTEGRTRLEAARQVIAARPAAGFASLVEFWSNPLLSAAAPGPAALETTRLVTRFFAFDVTIAYREVDIAASALFESNPQGALILRARRWTVDE